MCNSCNSIEDSEPAIMSGVNEFKQLFPKEKVTTNVIHEWCEVIESKSMIRRVLKKHFKLIIQGRLSFYELI